MNAPVVIVDLLRSLSITVVLAVHLNAIQPPTTHTLWDRLFSLFATNGSYGVSIFFVISGFLITRMIAARAENLSSVDLRDFYTRRIARIFPLLIPVLTIGFLLFHFGRALTDVHAFEFCFKDPTAHFSSLFWASLVFFFFNWYRIGQSFAVGSFGNGLHWDVFWSLAIEEQFYLGYPWLLRKCSSTRKLTLALLGICVTGPIARMIAAIYWPESFLAGFTTSFAAFDLIAMGALTYLLSRRLNSTKLFGTRNWLAIVPGLIVLVVTYVGTSCVSASDRIWAPTVIGLSVASIILFGERINTNRTLDILALPGRLSYGLYLLHATLLFLLWPILKKVDFIWLRYFVFLFGSLVAAKASFVWLELPANRWIRSQAGRRLQPAPTQAQ